MLQFKTTNFQKINLIGLAVLPGSMNKANLGFLYIDQGKKLPKQHF